MGKKVFIAWSGRLGQELAEGFRKTICAHPELETFISSDIKAGSQWFREIENKLDEVEFGIGCVAPGASLKPWFNFEAGYLFGRLKNFKLVLLGGEVLVEPLKNIQAIDGTKEEDLIKLLTGMVGTEKARQWIDLTFQPWRKIFQPHEERMQFEAKLENSLRPVLDSASLLKNEPQVRENKCLQVVINQAIQELSIRINRIRPNQEFAVPATQWPYYLVKLKEELTPRLKAVSLVDQQDTFWLQDIGREILNRSNPETDERIFVFIDDQAFNTYFEMIRQHAARYHVWVVTMQKLASAFPAHAKDLGILEADGNKLLAIYDKEQIQKQICYSVSPKQIKMHEELFEKIKRISRRVPVGDEMMVKELRESLFSELEGFARKEVEMSVYTSVLDYHVHAERHPYYIEMSQKMIEKFKQHRGDESIPCRVLELGAGTGLFTKRLAELPNVEVVALEIDWAYYNLAIYTLPKLKFPHVTILNEDSRRYDPDGPEGKFKYIFSCFSDHHIRASDKKPYFQNVHKNLEDGGLFIVGDKFLRVHDSKNETEHEEALKAFHSHIIELAEQANEEVLAELERDALRCKLDKEVDDAKVSSEAYRDLLQQNGFRPLSEDRIDPPNETFGGIYVHTAELA